jgi:hypothetical protein
MQIRKKGDEIKKKLVSDKKIFMGISHWVLCYIKFGCGGHHDCRSEMPDII